jgi:hypothetical protein
MQAVGKVKEIDGKGRGEESQKPLRFQYLRREAEQPGSVCGYCMALPAVIKLIGNTA